MKLLKTIENLIRESEDAYERALNMGSDEKEIVRLEKNYKDSIKLLKTFKQVKNLKKD
jgi:lipoate synthase